MRFRRLFLLMRRRRSSNFTQVRAQTWSAVIQVRQLPMSLESVNENDIKRWLYIAFDPWRRQKEQSSTDFHSSKIFPWYKSKAPSATKIASNFEPSQLMRMHALIGQKANSTILSWEASQLSCLKMMKQRSKATQKPHVKHLENLASWACWKHNHELS